MYDDKLCFCVQIINSAFVCVCMVTDAQCECYTFCDWNTIKVAC